jgi:CheY-like chemotaxis protein
MSASESAKSILIVEDNDIEREGMAAVLRQAGYFIGMAQSAVLALVYPDFKPAPDLILLDMMMPDIDGWRFLELRKNNPALAGAPVLIVSGLGVVGQEWAESLDACSVLKKPFDASDLLREVERCLA